MKQILPLAIAAMMLTGCGAANSFSAPRTATGAVSAKSRAVVEKNVRGIYRLSFEQLDANKSGFLTLDELPYAVGNLDPNAPKPDPRPAQQALLEKLDVNKNGRVTFAEFATRETLQMATNGFRREMGKQFAELDADGDRVLVAEEMAASLLPIELADLNKNGKVTVSEYEDAMADYIAKNGSIGKPPAPPAEPTEPVAPPAEPPAEEPADPASES